MHAARLTASALALLVLAGGCDRHPPAARYFPLEPGLEWQYRLERTTMDGTARMRHAVRSVPATAVPGADAVRETLVGRRYLYAVDAAGIYRIDGRHDGAPLLVLPATPQVESSWQAATTTSVLENTGPPWETLFRITVPVNLRYRIESMDSEVTTPAGRFERCLLVHGRGATSADVGNYIGRTRITVETREWFAPGVGLVRMERHETTEADAVSAGHLLMELDAWHGP